MPILSDAGRRLNGEAIGRGGGGWDICRRDDRPGQPQEGSPRPSPCRAPDGQRSFVAFRQRKGRTLPFVAKTEAEGVKLAGLVLAKGSKVYADEASHSDALEFSFPTGRINYVRAYSGDHPRADVGRRLHWHARPVARAGRAAAPRLHRRAAAGKAGRAQGSQGMRERLRDLRRVADVGDGAGDRRVPCLHPCPSPPSPPTLRASTSWWIAGA